jgi:hypothetical protein
VADRDSKRLSLGGEPELPTTTRGVSSAHERDRRQGWLSQLDVIAVANPGSFEQAWVARDHLSHDSLVRWDLPRGSYSSGHNWLTRDLVKVDCTIIDPDAGEKPLATPYAVCVGQPEIAARFPQVSIETVREQAEQIAADQNAIPADPASLPYGELIDWKIAEFKQAVRRAPRT